MCHFLLSLPYNASNFRILSKYHQSLCISRWERMDMLQRNNIIGFQIQINITPPSSINFQVQYTFDPDVLQSSLPFLQSISIFPFSVNTFLKLPRLMHRMSFFFFFLPFTIFNLNQIQIILPRQLFSDMPFIFPLSPVQNLNWISLRKCMHHLIPEPVHPSTCSALAKGPQFQSQKTKA